MRGAQCISVRRQRRRALTSNIEASCSTSSPRWQPLHGIVDIFRIYHFARSSIGEPVGGAVFSRLRKLGLSVAVSVMLSLPFGASGQDAATLEKQVKELTNQLQTMLSKSPINDAGLLAALRSLNEQLDKVPDGRITSLAQQLASVLVQIKPGDAVLSQKDVRTALDQVREAIENGEVPSQPQRLEVRAKRLTTALVASTDGAEPQLIEALTQLSDAIIPKLDVPYGIHVVYARAGDLRFVGNEARSCNATGYFRKQCSRIQECSIKDGATIEQICGYDPAPFAEERDRGAYVIFRCVTAGDLEWRKLLASDWDLFDPKSLKLFKTTGDYTDAHEAWLRGRAVFYCGMKSPLDKSARDGPASSANVPSPVQQGSSPGVQPK